jgi:ribonuclease D
LSSEEITQVDQLPVSALLAPRAIVDFVTTAADFAQMQQELLRGFGPIAIDAERASGFKYSQRAYLVQIFRRDCRVYLIDPIAIEASCQALSIQAKSLWQELAAATKGIEYIIHASSQDLPCLAELGLIPDLTFDTELGARIAGQARVGLGPLAENLLGIALAKEHSAVNWSLRPLLPEWLTYAALDVDILVDLRDQVEALLAAAEKLEWAKAEFAEVLRTHGRDFAAREELIRSERGESDGWRKISGGHKIKDRRSLALARDLWLARDQQAAEMDIAPGRIFNDEALIVLTLAKPIKPEDLPRNLKSRFRSKQPPIEFWLKIIAKSLASPDDQLPPLRIRGTGLPNPKTWSEKNPLAHARLTHARAHVLAQSAILEIPAENLISPEIVRRLAWNSWEELPNFGESEISDFLASQHARPWQISILSTGLCQAMAQREPLITAGPVAANDQVVADSDELRND